MSKNLSELMAQKKPIHMLGIGGCGMSAIARVLLKKGYMVSGSDAKESVNTILLKDEGATVFIGHDPKYVSGNSIIVVSAAIHKDNPELKEAQDNGLPVFARAEMLGYILSLHQDSIAFAGTHGKTTTSAMAAVLLNKAGVSPTFLVGGNVCDLDASSISGDSDVVIAEADESDGSICHLNPRIFVLNNIEKDHLDHFNDLEAIIDLFANCVERLKKVENSLLVINAEQWGNKILLNKIKEQNSLRRVFFGFTEEAQVRAINIRYKGQGSIYTLVVNGQVQGDLELAVPGEHNILNSLAVIAVVLELGLDFAKIRTAINSFTGAGRRFSFIGEIEGIKVYDDYAHHPSEITATLTAARHVFPESRILCAFQPHRYSRTMFFLNEFAESLELADKAIVTSIYAAGEEPIPEVSAEKMCQKIKGTDRAVYIEKKDDIAGYLQKELKPGDVFFTMGAGDIYSVGKEILNRLKNSRDLNAEKKRQTDGEKIIRIA